MTAATVSTTPSSLRLPPQNIQAEEDILGGILLDPDAITRVLEILRPEFFALPSHQIIYRVMLNLHQKGSATDLMTIVSSLGDKGLLDKIGGQMKVASLVERTISTANIDQYAALVAEKFVRRKLISTSNELAEIGYDSVLDLEDVLSIAEQKVFALTEHQSQQSLISVAETLVNTFQAIEDRSEGAISPGIHSGFYDLDEITGGFQRSDLIIVGGRPSMGKTAFCIQIASNVASQGVPVAIFSLEMSREQLVNRLLSNEANLTTDKFRSGDIRDNEWKNLIRAIGDLSERTISIDTKLNIMPSEIGSKARRFKAENGGQLGLIVIDYLQLMQGSNEANRNQELAKITRGLKLVAKELDVPMIVLSQLSRQIESRNNKRPTMADLRDSGAIEQDADLVLMLYRDDYYPDSRPSDQGIAEVIVAKHRNGPLGTVKLLFEPEFTRFKNLASNDSKG